MDKKFQKVLSTAVESVFIRKNLEQKLQSGKKLRVYLGVDPSGSELHLGHSVVLRKLRQFQELGHQVIFLIGDYTGMIGDPTGKSQTRKMLAKEEIAVNMKNYQRQAAKILDISKVEIRQNSEWYSKLSFDKVLKIASIKTVAQFLQREDFKNRMAQNRDISLVEFLYPLMQGYDSVMLKVDVELGGTDQLFNMLVGRDIQEHFGQTPQDVLNVPILEGLDGKEKMSKSLNNYIGLEEKPNEMYGKTMSLPDGLIIRYFKLCTDVPDDDLQSMEEALRNGENPRDYKMKLASQLVKQYHSEKEAIEAEKSFIEQFQKKQLPTDIPSIKISQNSLDIISLLVEAKLCSSKSDARRMIQQGAVKVNEEKIEQENLNINISSGLIVQVGKRKFCKIK